MSCSISHHLAVDSMSKYGHQFESQPHTAWGTAEAWWGVGWLKAVKIEMSTPSPYSTSLHSYLAPSSHNAHRDRRQSNRNRRKRGVLSLKLSWMPYKFDISRWQCHLLESVWKNGWFSIPSNGGTVSCRSSCWVEPIIILQVSEMITSKGHKLWNHT